MAGGRGPAKASALDSSGLTGPGPGRADKFVGELGAGDGCSTGGRPG